MTLEEVDSRTALLINTKEEENINPYELSFEARITINGNIAQKCGKNTISMLLEVKPGSVTNFKPILITQKVDLLQIDPLKKSDTTFTFEV